MIKVYELQFSSLMIYKMHNSIEGQKDFNLNILLLYSLQIMLINNELFLLENILI